MSTGGSGQVVAVCMATYEPDPALFEAQIGSIREQEGCEWHCFISDDASGAEAVSTITSVIGDDDRFTFSRSPENIGFYRNFERAIAMVPEGYELFALADQDDRWDRDKLAVLKREIGTAKLIYSDQRLVRENGDAIAPTYWQTRQNNHTNLASLLVANTVTGAASMFRRSVAEMALPFPELPGEQYHDHWLAMIALATGEVRYVDRALYDYVQHDNAVLGHEGANAGLMSAGWRRIDPRLWREILGGWASAYFDVFLRLKAIAQIVLERGGPEVRGRKRRTLVRFASSDRSAIGLVWLTLRPLRRLAGHNETMGMERVLARGVMYRHLAGIKRRLPRRLKERLARANRGQAPDGQTPQMRQKVAPLFPVVSRTQPPRVNLLIPTIDLEHLFGGYIAKFNLARRLAELGVRVRIVTVDPTPPLPKDWRDQVESYSQLEGLFGEVEIAFARDGKEPFRMSPEDRFIATTWWTAHIARRLALQTDAERFLYMIQEYEPLTVPPGGWAALAEESYTFPHEALFSTEILRDFFLDRSIGVFAAGKEAGLGRSLTFRNAITPIEAPTPEVLAARRKPSLIFYGRPEAHAARNLFEVGIEALRRAVAEGVFGEEWSFAAIGSTGSGRSIDLGDGRLLELKPRTGQDSYGRFLARHDLGLALMDAPHPSLVPIEMASAGMLVVTTTYGESKTAAKLNAVSANLIAAEPEVASVSQALASAASRIGDHRARVAGATVDWPDDWDESLDDELLTEALERIGWRSQRTA